MSNLLDDLPSSTSAPLQEPLQPTPATIGALDKKKLHNLPPDVLVRVFQELPVASLVTVALVSRRFKVLVYDDEIWDAKLHCMLRRDSGTLGSLLNQSSSSKALLEQGLPFLINNKPLNMLIPGLSADPYLARARAKSTGQAREKFKQLYVQLLPYYLNLRNRTNKSKVLLDYGTKPVDCARILNMLVGLCDCHVVDDWRSINENVDDLCQYFESASLHEFEVAYNVHNLPDMKTYAHAIIALNGGLKCVETFIQMHPIFFDNPLKPEENFTTSPNDLKPLKKFMSVITGELQQQSKIITEVFPASIDLFYTFADRVFEDVIADYVGQLLDLAKHKDMHLYLHTVAVVLDLVSTLVNVLTSGKVAAQIDKERGFNLTFKLMLPLLDEYLFEEKAYVEHTCDEQIEEWNNQTKGSRDDPSTRLTNQSRETFKRNYISAFKKVIALPVDLVSSAATTIASPFQRSASVASKMDDTSKGKPSPTTIGSTDSPQSTPPSTPKTSMQLVKSPTGSVHSLSSSKPSTPDLRDVDLTNALEDARQELDMLQDFLSLEISLQLIHVNKDSERRLQQFIRTGFPGRMKNDIQRTYEQIFMRLLKSLGTEHIKPAFNRACEHLELYKPSPESLAHNADDVPPLTEFFELIHVADVIQQMIQLYYDEDIAKYIDRNDFMNEVNKEKKEFERLLDDCVAQGMDRGIQVLLAQVEFILSNEQKPDDYNPSPNATIDLSPTKACQDTIQCIKTNTAMLNGAAEKATMDVFFTEIGRRFFEILCKHLKTQSVNEQGGFRYICDMNAYHDFMTSLRQKTVIPYYTALKSLSNIYIISSATDIKNVIHDLERYQGLMGIEDLFEFAACRTDWPLIRKVVQKDMMDCSIM